MKRALLALLALTPLPAFADNIAICVDAGKSEAICACAAEALAKETTAEDLAQYDAISAVFVEQRAEGLGWVEAWDKAVTTVAGETGMSVSTLQTAMNPVGTAHRKAMKGCE